MMRVGRVLVVIILSSAPAAGQTITSAGRSYAEIIELYRALDRAPALTELADLPAKDVTHGRDALLEAFASKWPDDTLRAAAMMRLAALMHTEFAFSERARRNTSQFRYQINIALVYIEKLAARDRASPFVRMWWLMTIALFHQQFSLANARDFANRAHESVGDSAELYLAMGATEELGWTQQHEADGTAGLNGDLHEAGRSYRSALAAKPDLDEARLHLGRVLTLLGDREAVQVLEGVAAASDEGFRYLARLFEGDDFERRGEVAEAERRYLAAIPLMPTAQSAHVALAHVRHVMGARAKAGEGVRITAQDRVTADTADPWFWYARGTFWHAAPYFDNLLALARK